MATSSPGSMWPRLFSVRSALIHRSCIAISVITGAPGCAKWPTSVRRSVTTPRAGASTLRSGQVELGLLDRRAGALQLRVVVAGFAGGLLRLAQLGLGAADLAARFLAGGLRDLEAAHRDRAGILLVQVFLAAGVAFGHVAVRLRGRQRGARRVDAGDRGVDRAAHRRVVGAGALQRDLVRLRIDVEQRLSGLHLVVVADVHLRDLAGHFGRHRHDEGLDARLRRARRQAVADEVEQQADEDQQPR